MEHDERVAQVALCCVVDADDDVASAWGELAEVADRGRDVPASVLMEEALNVVADVLANPDDQVSGSFVLERLQEALNRVVALEEVAAASVSAVQQTALWSQLCVRLSAVDHAVVDDSAAVDVFAHAVVAELMSPRRGLSAVERAEEVLPGAFVSAAAPLLLRICQLLPGDVAAQVVLPQVSVPEVRRVAAALSPETAATCVSLCADGGMVSPFQVLMTVLCLEPSVQT
jgi:hypothetical protein